MQITVQDGDLTFSFELSDAAGALAEIDAKLRALGAIRAAILSIHCQSETEKRKHGQLLDHVYAAMMACGEASTNELAAAVGASAKEVWTVMDRHRSKFRKVGTRGRRVLWRIDGPLETRLNPPEEGSGAHGGESI